MSRRRADVETLPQLVAAAAEQHGERVALIAPDERWTYRDLAAEAARVAEGLRELGVAPGERVGVLLPNWPAFFAAVFGIQAAGGTAVCLSTMATANELRHAVALSGMRRLIYTPRFLKHDYEAMLADLASGRAGSPADRPPRLETAIALARDGRLPAGALDFARLGTQPPPERAAAALRERDRSAPGEAAAIFFTSGSTAQPKAIAHAHRALVHQARTCVGPFGLEASDRTWGGLPMFFTGGFVAVALLSFASGAGVVLQDHFEAGAALDAMEREGVTFFAGWQLAPALCDHPTFPRRCLTLRKGIFSDTPSAARLLAPDHRAVAAYGMSETATFVCLGGCDDPPEQRRRGFGRPLPGVELRIVDPETGAEQPPGEVGEVIVKGPSLMLGYLGRPLEETLDADGFLHTGDLGRLDESGTLHFAGRAKDVVRTAGVNVAAAEVEACLERLAEVQSAYVVPVPHPVRGENVAAFVVPAAGAAVDPGRLLEHCRRELSSYKVPRHLFVLAAAAVPRTGTQKVDKLRLRADARERAGGATDLLGGGGATARP